MEQVLGGKAEPACQLLGATAVKVQRFDGLGNLARPLLGFLAAYVEPSPLFIGLHLNTTRRNCAMH